VEEVGRDMCMSMMVIGRLEGYDKRMEEVERKYW